MKPASMTLTEDSCSSLSTRPENLARILLVDLNNHAHYPTLPVGLMTAVLRQTGHEVELLSPLAVGVSGGVRDQRAKPWSYWVERLRWWTALTPTRGVRSIRQWIGCQCGPSAKGATTRILAEFENTLERDPEVILISAYYMYEGVVRAIVERCAHANLPVIIGGPGFTNPAAAQSWLNMPGLTALVAGECEPFLVELIERAHTCKDISTLPGCSVPDSSSAPPAPPLENLDALPFPDYDDFPWERYPNRVITMLTGRGCGWGVCSFCSDVLSSNGRSFRSRSTENVLAELAHHHQRYGVRLFHFSDLKINSDVSLWRGLSAGFQDSVPDGLWTCSVHVGSKGDQGLSFDELRDARRGGLVRITAGVETGSQRLLDSMAKGATVTAISDFLNNAREAGISIRITMFTGYPGETPDDLEASIALLKQHIHNVDRVHLSRFLIQPMTPVARAIKKEPSYFPELNVSFNTSCMEVTHTDRRINQRKYRRSLNRLLRIVYNINRQPLPEFARPLEGAM